MRHLVHIILMTAVLGLSAGCADAVSSMAQAQTNTCEFKVLAAVSVVEDAFTLDVTDTEALHLDFKVFATEREVEDSVVDWSHNEFNAGPSLPVYEPAPTPTATPTATPTEEPDEFVKTDRIAEGLEVSCLFSDEDSPDRDVNGDIQCEVFDTGDRDLRVVKVVPTIFCPTP